MEKYSMDPVQQHIYDQLEPHRSTMAASSFIAMTFNIAFLIKYKAGVDVKPSAVVVCIVKLKQARADNRERVTITFHDGPGHFAVILKLEVQTAFNKPSTIYVLEEKVTKAVKDIQDKDGGEGYGV